MKYLNLYQKQLSNSNSVYNKPHVNGGSNKKHNAKFDDNKNEHIKRFNNNIHKHSKNKFVSHSQENKNNINKHPHKQRIENLFEHARLKNIYLAQLQEEQKKQKSLKETQQCTFKPKIDKRSKAIVSSFQLDFNVDIYQRTHIWELLKNEKIQKEQQRIIEQQEEFSHKPLLTELDNGIFALPTHIMSHNLSTMLFFERQGKARENKHYKDNFFNKRSHSLPHKQRNKTSTSIDSIHNVNQKLLSHCKAVLHAELYEIEKYK